MARQRKEIGTTFYKRDVLFILEDDVTIEEKACFCDAIANLIAENYDFQIKDRLIRKEFLSITQRVKEAKNHLKEVNDRNQKIAEEREQLRKSQSDTNVVQSDTNVVQSDTNVVQSDTNVSNTIKNNKKQNNTIQNNTIQNNTIKENINNNPPNPLRGLLGHGGAYYKFKDFFQRVKSIQVPERIEKVGYKAQFVWRMADGVSGYNLAIDTVCKRLANSSDENFACGLQDINKSHTPMIEFEAVKLALAIAQSKKCDSNTVNAFCKEIDASHNEDGIYRTMLEKVEHMANHKISNISGFLKNR